jgi:hypothetical protein
MTEINPDNVKEILEVPAAEAIKYTNLGWIEVDTYIMNQQNFSVIAWAKDDTPLKP